MSISVGGWIKLVFLSLAAIVLLALLVVGYWAIFPYRANAGHIAQVRRDPQLMYEQRARVISLLPAAAPARIGLIFYPGGLIESESYIYRLHQLTRQGVGVFIVQPPLHLAMFDPYQASSIQAAHPEISAWYIGGHSLGGIVGCWYAHDHPNQVAGVVLLAAYCLQDVSHLPLRVLSVSGGQDTLISANTLSHYRSNVPDTSEVVELPGFNHSSFGDYGLERRDAQPLMNDQQIQAALNGVLASFLVPSETSLAD